MDSSPTHFTNGFVDLQEWQLIGVKGNEAKSYLQGQFTINMNTLTDNHFSFAAQCDAKGKVFSNMLVFQQDDQLFYIERQSVVEDQLDDLKKYAIFSKVSLTKDNRQLVGLFGDTVSSLLTALGLPIPTPANNLRIIKGVVIIRYEKPNERFILIASPEKMQQLKDKITHLGCAQYHSTDWLILDIKAGYPIIDKPNVLCFLPQALCLDKIGAISFNKGCYRGQEMVARATYRGANKRGLFSLIGTSSITPSAGDSLEIAMGHNWRETGRILAAGALPNGEVIIQAVLSQDTANDATFRLKGGAISSFSLR